MQAVKPEVHTIGIATLKARNAAAGRHFFSPNTTRFFRSRYPRTAYTADHRKAYFVTSEAFDDRSPRLYTLRVYDLETQEVDTIGEFQAYASLAAAMKDLRAHLELDATPAPAQAETTTKEGGKP